MSSYQTPQGLWRAVTDRARATGRPIQEDQQWFLRERLFARVFAQPDQPWVLKGGTAMLARVSDARWSRDVDFMTQQPDLERAVRDLQHLTSAENEDLLSMKVIDTQRSLGALQGRTKGTTLVLEVTAGRKQLANVKIDLVVGSLMTGDPEASTLRSRLGLAGLDDVPVRLYPVSDHIADKVIATESSYGGHPSSRIRDLVDLVILAKTQRVDGAALHQAIAGEREHQGLPSSASTYDPPPSWQPAFAQIAARSALTRGMTFEAATAYVRELVEPAMSRNAVDGLAWDPEQGTYRPSQEVAPTPSPVDVAQASDSAADKPVHVTEHTRGGSFTIGHQRRLPRSNPHSPDAAD